MNNSQQNDAPTVVLRQDGNIAPAYFIARKNGWEIYNDARDILYISTKYTFFNVDNGFSATAYNVRGFISNNGNWIEGDIHYNVSSLEEFVIMLNRSGAFRKAISEINNK